MLPVNATSPVVTPEKTRPLAMPPWHVIVENDEDHSMGFVMETLMKVFRFTTEKAFELMMHAHEKGEAVVWTGSKEVAEHKYEMLQSVHEKHWQSGRDLGPVRCRIEAAR